MLLPLTISESYILYVFKYKPIFLFSTLESRIKVQHVYYFFQFFPSYMLLLGTTSLLIFKNFSFLHTISFLHTLRISIFWGNTAIFGIILFTKQLYFTPYPANYVYFNKQALIYLFDFPDFPTYTFIPTYMIINSFKIFLPTCLFQPTRLFGTLEYLPRYLSCYH